MDNVDLVVIWQRVGVRVWVRRIGKRVAEAIQKSISIWMDQHAVPMYLVYKPQQLNGFQQSTLDLWEGCSHTDLKSTQSHCT